MSVMLNYLLISRQGMVRLDVFASVTARPIVIETEEDYVQLITLMWPILCPIN
jgi:hypothetical protein